MRSLFESIQSGDVLEGREIVELAKVIDGFSKTEVYKILCKLNENAVKELLTYGKTPDESAEHRLGKMEGIQEAFENRIKTIIIDGDREMERVKEERKLKRKDKEAEEPEGEPTSKDSSI